MPQASSRTKPVSKGVGAGDGTKARKAIAVKSSGAAATLSSPGSEASPHIARSHRAFGLFPNALLLSGYGDRDEDIINYRSFTATVDDGLGGQVERKLEMSTDSKAGLPRGKDPIVLLGLLKLLFDRGAPTNAISFRKQELMDVLGWENNSYTQEDIEGALNRYYNTSFRGVNLWQGRDKLKKVDKHRRLIISYDVVDERKIRYAAERSSPKDQSQLFTTIEFHPDLINEIRQIPYGIDFDLLRSLTSPIARRLLEVLNLATYTGSLDFEFDIFELAHERLGIARTYKAPSQCWAKMKPAFETLKENGYIKSYDYEKGIGRIAGQINRVSAHKALDSMPPIPSLRASREDYIERAQAFGTTEYVARSLVENCPEEQLGMLGFVIRYIEGVRSSSPKKKYNYGGWFAAEAKHLLNSKTVSVRLQNAYHEYVEQKANHQENGEEVDAVTTSQQTLPLAENNHPDREAGEAWAKVMDFLKTEANVGKEQLRAWFNPITPVKLDDNTLTLRAPNQVLIDWVTDSYEKELSRALESIFGGEIKLSWHLQPLSD